MSRQGQRAGPERREKERWRQIHRSPARTEAINWPLVPAVPRQTLTIYYLHLGDHPSQLPPRHTAGVNVMDSFVLSFCFLLSFSLSVLLPYMHMDTPTLRIREHVRHFERMQILCASRTAHLTCLTQTCTVYLLEFTVSASWLNLFD